MGEAFMNLYSLVENTMSQIVKTFYSNYMYYFGHNLKYIDLQIFNNSTFNVQFQGYITHINGIIGKYDYPCSKCVVVVLEVSESSEEMARIVSTYLESLPVFGELNIEEVKSRIGIGQVSGEESASKLISEAFSRLSDEVFELKLSEHSHELLLDASKTVELEGTSSYSQIDIPTLSDFGLDRKYYEDAISKLDSNYITAGFEDLVSVSRGATEEQELMKRIMDIAGPSLFGEGSLVDLSDGA